jgi:transaldolase/glucose-6-phosphate isomerase
VWNDNIQRTFVTNGDLQRLVEQDALGGVTSNPTIFEKAIGGSSDYDDDLKQYVEEGEDAEGVFKRLAVTDITLGADILRPVYDRTDGQDGYISIEVSPSAAHDTPKTLDDAHYFWDAIGRPNVMIKVPASTEGIPAAEQLISEGINVNITLIFASEVYEQVIDAYLKGLEKRVEQGKPIDHLGSVASFFVSRVDTLVDKLLEEKAKKDNGENAAELKALGARLPLPTRRSRIKSSSANSARSASEAGGQGRAGAATAVGQHQYQEPKLSRHLLCGGAGRARHS